MALVLADRVRETTAITGTGTATLLGAVSGYQSFSAVGDANTTYYVIANQSATEWEVGIGTYTASGTTLSRDTVLSSSNSGSLVNFSAGTKDVFVDYPAGRAVYEDAAGNVDGYPITGGTINNTTIGATTPSTGVFTTLTATGQTSLGGVAGSESFRAVVVAGQNCYVEARGGVYGTNTPALISRPTGAGAGFNIANGNQGPVSFYTNDVSSSSLQARVSHTASAVNYVQVTGAATGGLPAVSAQGSDSSISMSYVAKGTGGYHFFYGNNTAQFGIAPVASSVNRLEASGAATAFSPKLAAAGTDTNISQVFQSKGTGAINLAPGSSGVNISNGGTVTAITRTAGGGGYTSTPTVVISAPTTAGGVQATATSTISTTGTPTIVSGGTGYTVNDVLTIVGGTPVSVAATMTVTAVSGGVITAASYTNFAQYTVAPTGTISVTGGTGSSATFNISFAVTTAFTITNAGSGYVEQPTVTFSGGGGSGAAAYATVGSVPTLKTLGGALDVYTPGGMQVRVFDKANAINSLRLNGNASGAGADIMARGGDANVNLNLISYGSSNIDFFTNHDSFVRQARVAHTASAVNYVQVTGAATGNQPVISTQGSDANVILNIASKGNASILFNANSAEQFRTGAVASAVNSLQLNGATTGNSPSLQARGTNTDIDVVFTPKGTGNVRFGTYTGTALSIAGYIEIKDSGGTVRKLAVVA
jgi:hypothetical protein